MTPSITPSQSFHRFRLLPIAAAAFLAFSGVSPIQHSAFGGTITVLNPSFEDTTGMTSFREFTFGDLPGWDLYDPDGIVGGGYFPGTLRVTPPEFFSVAPPDGQRVAIAFNRANTVGQGEYGFVQTLGDVLQANTTYELSVEIGNIASGTDTGGTFYNLDGFPGYRIDLLAGDTVIASDDNSLAGSIAEGMFETSLIQIQIGDAHAQLGESLGIRLVNLNQLDPTAPTADVEVDFDRVHLQSFSAVPEPGTCGMMLSIAGLACWRRRKRIRRQTDSSMAHRFDRRSDRPQDTVG